MFLFSFLFIDHPVSLPCIQALIFCRLCDTFCGEGFHWAFLLDLLSFSFPDTFVWLFLSTLISSLNLLLISWIALIVLVSLVFLGIHLSIPHLPTSIHVFVSSLNPSNLLAMLIIVLLKPVDWTTSKLFSLGTFTMGLVLWRRDTWKLLLSPWESHCCSFLKGPAHLKSGVRMWVVFEHGFLTHSTGISSWVSRPANLEKSWGEQRRSGLLPGSGYSDHMKWLKLMDSGTEGTGGRREIQGQGLLPSRGQCHNNFVKWLEHRSLGVKQPGVGAIQGS